jgi:hypothetical protein
LPAAADRVRRLAAGLLLLVFFAHAYFVGALGWNQSARIGAILTFVEPGPNRFTLRIDPFVTGARGLSTGDWALGSDGHYYANKAPGVSWLGTPAYAALWVGERLAGLDPRGDGATRLNAVALNLWCSVTATAAATALLFIFLAAAGAARVDALLGALAYAFGTLAFPYDTSLWGHTTAAACVLAALCLAWWPGGARRPTLAGALGGAAVLVEYTAALPLVAVAAGLLGRRARWRERLQFGAGAALPLLALLLYHHAAFGDFFVTATARGNPLFRDPGRAFGGVLGPIAADAVIGLLVSPWRGLFLYCPVLLFALAGARQRWREGQRAFAGACLAAFAATLLFVASFNAWWGGWAAGPRYLIVAIPLLAILAPRLAALPRWARGLWLAAAALSFANMLALAAVEPMLDEAEKNPLYGLAYPLLLGGRYPHVDDAINLGRWLGLAPPLDLAMFGLLAGAGAFALLRTAGPASGPATRRRAAPS